MDGRAGSRLREAMAHAGPADPVVLVGVHNALVGELVHRAGLPGGWVSSLEMSAIHGLPDRNLLGLAEMAHAVRSMAGACELPLVVDVDNGYGTLESMVRAVRELGGAGAAGVCIEDTAFPKRNSFLGEAPRLLEDIAKFQDKIAASKQAQRDPDFVVVARTEALIAGEGISAALRRASAYADAGADVLLIHSRCADGSEAVAAAARWHRDTPLLCIPTAFSHLSPAALGLMGYRIVVYANQLLRASVRGIESALASVRSGRPLNELELQIAGMDELLALSEHFLPTRRSDPPRPELIRSGHRR